MKIRKLARYTMPLIVASALAGCGSDGGSTVVPVVDQPSVDIPAMPNEVVTATSKQIVIAVVDPDPTSQVTRSISTAYSGWRLVPVEAEGCSDLIGEPLALTGSDAFGPYWTLSDMEDNSCLSFTVVDENDEVMLPTVEINADSTANGYEAVYKKGETKELTSRTEAFTGLPVAAIPSYPPIGENQEAGTMKAIINFLDVATLNGEVAADKYDNWTLHLWNGTENGVTCNALEAGTFDGAWENTTNVPAGKDANGPYWELSLSSETGCFYYIVRDKDNGKLIGSNMMLDFSEFSDRTVTVVKGDATTYDSRDEALETLAAGITGRAAHWVDAETLLWDTKAENIRLYVTKGEKLEANDKRQLVSTFVELEGTELSDELKAKFPHLAEHKAFTLPESVNAHGWISEEVVAVGVDAEGFIQDATLVQKAKLLDALFYAEAKDAKLGATVVNDSTAFNLWAPTAKTVTLKLYDENLEPLAENGDVEMQLDMNSGIWNAELSENLESKYYQYEITVYHPATRQWETSLVTDPYSLSLSVNSRYSQVVDLANSAKPAGWDDQEVPTLNNPEEQVIYETHLRDLTSAPGDGGTDALDGKYSAITETERESIKQLASLAENGMNTIHLLNLFDIATVEEDPEKVVALSDTVEKFCGLKEDAAVCDGDQTQTLQDLLESYDPATGDAQALMNDLRMLDTFNWGYDPFHYTAPEGSYATDAQGTVRINEYRTLIMKLHEMGYRVVMDVVYNHTNSHGLDDKSVLDKIVPGYYQRLNKDTGNVENSTCCSNTATENLMMGKLMTDSLVTWAQEYKIDGFRFDLMGHQPLDLMEASLEAVKAVDADTYFYGEGWNFGEVVDDALFVQATQANMGGTEIGTFSDRLRDAVRGGGPFDSENQLRANQGFANAAVWNEMQVDLEITEGEGDDKVVIASGEDASALKLRKDGDMIRLGMAGNLAKFVLLDQEGKTKQGENVDYNGQKAGYTVDPQENISYVSKHDNQTLWDNNMYKIATEVTSDQRAQMQIIALSTNMLGQGIPFFHMGSELLRSKSMQRDSYDSGDWYNFVNYNMSGNNWNVGLPREDKDGANWPLIKEIIADANAEPTEADIAWTDARFKELLSIRTGSPLFSLETADEVKARVDFQNTGVDSVNGVIVMSIDDGTGLADLDSENDAIVVVINATDTEQVMPVTGAAGFKLHSALVEGTATFADGKFTVPALTTAVFVKPQGETQGAGLAVDMETKDLSSIPVFGDEVPYLRGLTDTNWTAVDPLTFDKSSIYTTTITLEAGDYGFKVAGDDWDTTAINFGSTGPVVLGEALALISGEESVNISLTLEAYSFVTFTFDASDLEAPKLTVTAKPVPVCEVLADSDETAPLEADLYLVGKLADWNFNDEAFKLGYKGDNVYQVIIDGVIESELFFSHNNWTKYMVADAVAFSPVVEYSAVKGDGDGNNSVNLPDGSWSFKYTVDAEDVTKGTILIQECSK